MSPRGRRPASEDTRAVIVHAARNAFATAGYDATSLRGIARRAGVDPALVHHYFAGKAALFVATMDVPIDPAQLIAGILGGPRDEIGLRMARSFLTVWDSPEGRVRFQAIARAAMSHEDAARMLREFLLREVFGRILQELKRPDQPTLTVDEHIRAGLAVGQLLGMALARYVLSVPGIVDADADALARLVAPALQRYIAG